MTSQNIDLSSWDILYIAWNDWIVRSNELENLCKEDVMA
jgi:hypothetical protein